MYKLESLIKDANNDQAEINGKWVPARPIRIYGFWHDLKDAWAVFTRKADAVEWPEGQ
jgi:hypothetical protein